MWIPLLPRMDKAGKNITQTFRRRSQISHKVLAYKVVVFPELIIGAIE